MNSQDVAAYVKAHADQTASVFKNEADSDAIQSLVGALEDVRNLLIHDNGIAQEVADAMLLGLVATLLACMQLDGSPS